MKEGYLQIKIRELDYKIKQQMELANQINKELERLQLSKKQQKILFKKLNDLETFKNKIEKDLLIQNKKMIEAVINESNTLIDERVKTALNKRFKPVEREIASQTKPLQKLEAQLEQLNTSLDKITYLKHLVELLIEELMQQRVFSSEKLEILKKRASLRAEKSSQ